MMVFFKHNEMMIPVKKIMEVQQNGGYYRGAKRTKVVEDASFETLASKKKLKYILLEVDSGEWVSSGEAIVVENALGITIEPKEYYSIEDKEYTV